MQESQTFEIEIPVSANQRLIRSKNRAALINSQKYRDWCERAEWQIRSQRRWATILGRVGVSVVLHFADKRRRDLDNCLKGLFDALTHAEVYQDDSQIDKLYIVRGAPEKPGKASVFVWELKQD